MSKIVYSWAGVEWATEGEQSQIYDADEDEDGRIRWRRSDINSAWSAWADKWELDQSFWSMLEAERNGVRECRCTAEQLLWQGHLNECRYPRSS